MKQFLRMAAIGTGILVVLVAALIGIAASFISPNDFKPQIEAMVLKTTGKPLVLRGDLGLSLFPGISITAGPAELAQNPSFGAGPLVSVDKVSASVALMPLLRGAVEIGTVSVSGVRLNLAVNNAGKTNWEPPVTAAEKPTPAPSTPGAAAPADLAAISLDKVVLADIVTHYTDMRSGENLHATVSRLELGPVGVGRTSSFSLAASCTKGEAAPISLALKGSFSIPRNLAQETPFAFEGTLDKTPFSFKGKAALPGEGSARRVILTAEAAVGAIDFDAYLAPPAKQPAKTAPPARTAQKPGTASDVALAKLLRTLTLDLRLTVASLTVAKLPVTAITFPLKADKGLVTVAPASMTIAGSPLRADITLDATGNTIRSHIAGNWKNARAGELVTIFTGKDMVTGALNADWDITGTGLAWPAMGHTLGGKAAFSLENGSVPALRLIPPGLSGLPVTSMDLHALQCSATWQISKGVARNNDLQVVSAGLTAKGRGEVIIPAQSVNYTVTANLPRIGELPVPTEVTITVTGPLASPTYSVNKGALLLDTARNLLNPETKTGREVRKGIDSLFDSLKRR